MQTNGQWGRPTEASTGEPRDVPTGEPPMGQVRLSVAEAARALGITEGAVRSRIKRGTLPTIKEDGNVFVLWGGGTSEANHPPYTDVPTDEPSVVPPGEPSDQPGQSPSLEDSELVESLREQVDYLREQLDAEREAGRRKDHLLAAALERIPAIEPPDTTPPENGPPGTREQPATAENGAGRGNVSEDAEAPVGERRESRSWWRRFFGFE